MSFEGTYSHVSIDVQVRNEELLVFFDATSSDWNHSWESIVSLGKADVWRLTDLAANLRAAAADVIRLARQMQGEG